MFIQVPSGHTQGQGEKAAVTERVKAIIFLNGDDKIPIKTIMGSHSFLHSKRDRSYVKNEKRVLEREV